MTDADREFEHRFTHPNRIEVEALIAQEQADLICKHYVKREDVKPLIEALQHIARFPVHSEPFGSVTLMQDLAATTLEQARLKGLL